VRCWKLINAGGGAWSRRRCIRAGGDKHNLRFFAVVLMETGVISILETGFHKYPDDAHSTKLGAKFISP
jgi:hypothetical protein